MLRGLQKTKDLLGITCISTVIPPHFQKTQRVNTEALFILKPSIWLPNYMYPTGDQCIWAQKVVLQGMGRQAVSSRDLLF